MYLKSDCTRKTSKIHKNLTWENSNMKIPISWKVALNSDWLGRQNLFHLWSSWRGCLLMGRHTDWGIYSIFKMYIIQFDMKRNMSKWAPGCLFHPNNNWCYKCYKLNYASFSAQKDKALSPISITYLSPPFYLICCVS